MWPMAIRRRSLCWLLGLAAMVAVTSSALASAPAHRVGPRVGALLLMGGGDVTPEIAHRFVALAGGRRGHFVYIPTAAPDEEIVPADLTTWFRTTFGVEDITILHTRDRPMPLGEAMAFLENSPKDAVA